jgi:hypothetical protein
MNEPFDLFGLFRNHDVIITDAAYFVVLGMACVLLLNRFFKRFIYPHLPSPGGLQQFLVLCMW